MPRQWPLYVSGSCWNLSECMIYLYGGWISIRLLLHSDLDDDEIVVGDLGVAQDSPGPG